MVKVQSPNLWITKEVPSGVFFFFSFLFWGLGCGEWGLLLVVVCGFLIAGASHVVEHRL